MDEEKAADQMTVLVVEPGYAPYEKTILHDVQAMQEIVGGLITAIYPYRATGNPQSGAVRSYTSKTFRCSSCKAAWRVDAMQRSAADYAQQGADDS